MLPGAAGGVRFESMRKGIGVSPGVAVGRAYCIHEIFVNPKTRCLEQSEVLAELERYEQARLDEAAIFGVHESILHDTAFEAKVRHWIVDERQTAQSALHHILNDYTSLFARTKDDYLRERLSDLRDVVIRLSGHLTEALSPDAESPEGPVILVADELLPSQVATLGQRHVAGIVTQAGGGTSHAAILARSRGIPAVSGVRGILKQVTNGDLVVVDGREGNVIVQPDAETESAYRKLQREFFDLKDAIAENRDREAVSADGQRVELLANINSVLDAKAATAMGADGVGLFRTEYLFLTHPSVPDEEEQRQAYCDVIEASPNHRITIRTLDLGGDKTIPYLGHSREANPFRGWRSIRLSFEHPEFFGTQIRAVLQAAAAHSGGVRLMFPMITTLV